MSLPALLVGIGLIAVAAILYLAMRRSQRELDEYLDHTVPVVVEIVAMGYVGAGASLASLYWVEVNQPDLPPEKVRVPKPVYDRHSKRDTIELYKHPGTGLLIHAAMPRKLPRLGFWALVTGAAGISLIISSVFTG